SKLGQKGKLFCGSLSSIPAGIDQAGRIREAYKEPDETEIKCLG
ncbi:unnamed protein product, partial [marine sediment metagenome]